MRSVLVFAALVIAGVGATGALSSMAGHPWWSSAVVVALCGAVSAIAVGSSR